MKKIDVLHYLSRNDKWYLGGANRLLWAPTYPVFLDFPGLWDEAHYYNYELKPLFTWTLLDDEGNEIPLRFKSRKWNPAFLTQEYESQVRTSHFELQTSECKAVLPVDVATSLVRIKNTSKRPVKLHFVAWTAQEHLPSKQSVWLSDVEYHNGVMSFKKSLRPSIDPHLELACALVLNRKVRSHSINLSERTALHPHWSLTPWYEKFSGGALPNETKLTGVTNEGLVYIALHVEITLKPLAEDYVAIAFAAAPTLEETKGNIHPVIKQSNPMELSTVTWEDHFASVPTFSCSDEFLTRYYWYRWYGLRLNTMFGSEGNYKRPFVCEGIGYFRAPISYSAPCHMLENRWHHEPELAQGSLLVFIDNHYETGQEYMHRYTAVNPRADQDNWGDVFRLKGVDVTVYIYELKRALSVIAEQLSRPDEAELWNIEAEKIKNAVLLKMWDTNEEMFFDVDPTTGKRMNCPWNGRVWPMTNSHIAEALAHSAIRFRDPLLKKQAAEFISKFVRMMFLDGDPDRPNCFEHYNPFSGKPSVYREIDDYQHSWVSDLIIKYVCGIRPDQHTVTIDPFPFGLKQAQIDNVFVRGRRLKVDVKGKRFVVFLDGKQQAESTIGKPIAIQV